MLVLEDGYAAPSVHKGLGEEVVLDSRGDYQGELVRVVDSRRVVLLGPGDGLFRPVQLLGGR